MKEYFFEFDISGKCSVKIKAASDEEAAEKMRSEHEGYELVEWNVDLPWNFSKYSDKDILSYSKSRECEDDE